MAEWWADAAVHAAGLLVVVLGCITLGTTVRADAVTLAATALYVAGLCGTFACSAAYNLAPAGRWKPRLRRLDHAAIFLMIGGTYSPVALLGIGGTFGAVLLALVWLGALAGVAMKLVAFGRFERASIAAYLLLGWVGVFATPALLRAMDPASLGFLAAGGALYSLGVIAHVATRLRFNDAIWHAFVLAAAACHYVVVFRLVTG